MRIKCKSSGKFLANIDVEGFYETIGKMLNTNIEIPLTAEFYCKGCKRAEIYDIYKTHYVKKIKQMFPNVPF